MTSISNPSMMNRLTSKTIGKTRKSRENFSSCLFYGTRNGQKLVHTHTESCWVAGPTAHTHTQSAMCHFPLSLSLPLMCVCILCVSMATGQGPVSQHKSCFFFFFFWSCFFFFFLVVVVVVVPPSRGRLYSIFAAL